MIHDLIVAEVRRVRDEYARQFDYDIRAICADLRRQQQSSGRIVVDRSGIKSGEKEAHPQEATDSRS